MSEKLIPTTTETMRGVFIKPLGIENGKNVMITYNISDFCLDLNGAEQILKSEGCEKCPHKNEENCNPQILKEETHIKILGNRSGTDECRIYNRTIPEEFVLRKID